MIAIRNKLNSDGNHPTSSMNLYTPTGQGAPEVAVDRLYYVDQWYRTTDGTVKTAKSATNGYITYTEQAAVPEPMTCALFALGLGALVTRRRRK